MSVMEAMSCGLAVACTRIGGTSDMIEDGVSGLLVPQNDAGSMAQAMANLFDAVELRRTLGARARRTAEDRFDYRRCAAQLAQFIEHESSGGPPQFATAASAAAEEGR